MKRKLCLFMALIMTVLLCGCGSSNRVHSLSPEQTSIISEYATHLLVKHSELSDRYLLNEKDLEKGVVQEAEERERKRKADAIAQTYLNAQDNKTEDMQSEGTGDGEEEFQTLPPQTIAEFLGEDRFSIDYDSYELCESYPAAGEDDFYMAMDASSGRQLCVVKFSVHNNTGEDSEFDMLGKKSNYVLEIPDEGSIPAQATMLLDDLSSYRGTIAGGVTEQMVLVFEVDDTIVGLDDAQVVIKNDSGENKITLY